MSLLLFRTCNKVIANTWSPNERAFDKDFSNIIGFYFKGHQDKTMGLFVKEGKLLLSLDEFVFDTTNIKFQLDNICVSENVWEAKITFEDDRYSFLYKAFNYYSFDDDSEVDINFGLWIKSILENPEKRERYIYTKRDRDCR